MARRTSPDLEREVCRLYGEEDLSVQEVADRTGLSAVTVRRVRDRLGVPRRPRNHWGANHPRWKGGRHVGADGYVSVWADPEDFIAWEMVGRKAGSVLEHRLVMAQRLGRPLLRSETVHHLDGDRQNNRIDNLELRSGHHGPGVSVRCRSCGSHDVVAVPLTQHQKIEEVTTK